MERPKMPADGAADGRSWMADGDLQCAAQYPSAPGLTQGAKVTSASVRYRMTGAPGPGGFPSRRSGTSAAACTHGQRYRHGWPPPGSAKSITWPPRPPGLRADWRRPDRPLGLRELPQHDRPLLARLVA
jgi:hypothetical protein